MILNRKSDTVNKTCMMRHGPRGRQKGSIGHVGLSRPKTGQRGQCFQYLNRAYAAQMEALKRYRSTRLQKMTSTST